MHYLLAIDATLVPLLLQQNFYIASYKKQGITHNKGDCRIALKRGSNVATQTIAQQRESSEALQESSWVLVKIYNFIVDLSSG